MSKVCLQKEYGPTPCFRDTGMTICSLSFCPVEVMHNRNLENKLFDLLHSHCVMSEDYGRQNDFELGKGEYIAAIANRVVIR